MKDAEVFPLVDLPIGSEAMVVALDVSGVMRRRLLDLGLVPQSKVLAVRKSPAGDPTAYRVRGTTIGLRREEASRILVRQV